MTIITTITGGLKLKPKSAKHEHADVDVEKLIHEGGDEEDDIHIRKTEECKQKLACILWSLVLLFLLSTMALFITVTVVKFGPGKLLQKCVTNQEKESVRPINASLSNSRTDAEARRQAYLRNLYNIQQARLRTHTCNPIKKVMRIEQLMEEDPAIKQKLHKILIPYQSVVLSRCLRKQPGVCCADNANANITEDNGNYCADANGNITENNGNYCADANNAKSTENNGNYYCSSFIGFPKKMKEIVVMVYNATLGRKYPTRIKVEVHEKCICK